MRNRGQSTLVGVATLLHLLGCGGTQTAAPTVPPETTAAEAAPVEPEAQVVAPVRAPVRVRREDEPMPDPEVVLQDFARDGLSVAVASPNGQLLALMSYQGAVAVMDLESGQIRVHDHPFIHGGNDWGSFQFDASGTVLMARGTSSNVVRPKFVVYDLHTGRRSEAAPGQWRRQDYAELDPNGRQVAWLEDVDEGLTLRIAPITDLEEGPAVEVVANVRGSGAPDGLWYSPDGRRLAICGRRSISLRDGSSGREVASLQPAAREGADSEAEPAFSACAFVQDRAELVTLEWGGLVRTYDPSDGRELGRFRLESLSGFADASELPAEIVAGGRLLQITGPDGTLLVDTRIGAPRALLRDVWSATLTDDGSRAYDFSSDGFLHVLDTTTGNELYAEEIEPESRFMPLAGRRVLRLDRNSVRPFDLDTREYGNARMFEAGPFSVWRTEWRHDSRGLALLGRSGSASVTDSGQLSTSACVTRSNILPWTSGDAPRPLHACGAPTGQRAQRPEGGALLATSRDGQAELLLVDNRLQFLVGERVTRVRSAVPHLETPRLCDAGRRVCRYNLFIADDSSRALVYTFIDDEVEFWIVDLGRGRLVMTSTVAVGAPDVDLRWTGNMRGLLIHTEARAFAYAVDRRRRELFTTFEGRIGPARQPDEGTERIAVQVDDRVHVLDMGRARELIDRPLGGAEWWLSRTGDHLVLEGEQVSLVDIDTGTAIAEGQLRSGEILDDDGTKALRCTPDRRLELRPLTSTEAIVLGPCRFAGPATFSPDGRFVSVAESPYAYVYRTDGSGYIRLATLVHGDGDPNPQLVVIDSSGHVQTNAAARDTARVRIGRPIGGRLVIPAEAGLAQDDLLARFFAPAQAAASTAR